MWNSFNDRQRSRVLIVAIAAGLFSQGALGAQDYVSRPAGFVRVGVGTTNSTLAAMPLDPFNPAIQTLFAGQLLGGSTVNLSDLLLKYDPVTQTYITFWKTNNGTWYQSPQAVPTTNKLTTGEGVWIQNRHGAQDVFLVGRVNVAATQTISFTQGLSLFGYPFSARIALNSTDLAADGAWGSTNMSLSDQILEGSTSNRYWLFKKTDHPDNNKWLTSPGAVASVELMLGSGYWYQRAVSNSFPWSEACPYADVFSVGSGAPQITDITIGTNKDSATLAISCSGAAGEKLEVFYQDVASNGSFSSVGGWFVAAADLVTAGQTNITWTDLGATNRPAIANVHHRAYLVGRQDTDSDNDGLSDAREQFVHQTSPTLGDTDADGLGDAAEVNTYGTDPRQADTDSDGMGDGDEVRWGRNPTSADAYAVLPWSTSFETNDGYAAGGLNGQDGWLVPAGSAVIQTSSVALGAQAARWGGGTSGPVSGIQHLYANNTGAVVWTDMRARLLPGPLPELAGAADNLAAVFAVTRSRRLAGYDGARGAWVEATNRPIVDTAAWLHLTVKKDYLLRRWSLYLDGLPVLQDLAFADLSVTRFSRVAAQGSETIPSYVDDLSISETRPAFIDSDGDGLPDSVEDVNGNGIVDAGETDAANADTDGDGMDDGREIELGFNPLVADSFTQIPWFAGFEGAEGYSLGALNNQQGWVAATSAAVQSSSRYAGTNALRLSALADTDSYAQRYIGAEGLPVVWFELYAQLPAGVLPDAAPLAASNSVLVAVNERNSLCAYDRGLQRWVPAVAGGAIKAGDWVRLSFRLDYGARTWSAYSGSQRVFRDMPFADPNVRALSGLKLYLPADPGIPSEVLADSLTLAVTEPDNLDNDSDGMPNAWERLYGFNPEDPTDQLGDSDDDGLMNFEEFLAGSNPNAVDTDGDGVSDYEEVKLALSNPLVADFNGQQTILSTIYGSQITNKLGNWTVEGTQIYARERNGYLEYDVTVPADGVYVLEVEGSQHNPLTSQKLFDLTAFVDGHYTGRQWLEAAYGSSGFARFYLPRLSAGTHRARIQWNNLRANTFLTIKTLRLISVGGPDTNTNGIPDWLDHRLNSVAHVDATPEASLTSPVCIEGDALYLHQVSVAASYVPPGQTDQVATVNHGIERDWYANVLLSPSNVTLIRVAEENGRSTRTNAVAWTQLNVLAPPADIPMVRRGDSLLLTANPAGATNGTVGIEVVGVTNYATSASVPVPHRFESAGTFTINGVYSNGVSTNAQISVKVVDAAFNGNPACMIGWPRDWVCPQIPPEALLESDPRLAVVITSMTSGGVRINLTTWMDEPLYMLARLGEDGAVMANARVDGVTAAQPPYWRVVEMFPDGGRMVEARLFLGTVPPDIEVCLHIFVGGVTFDDGTIDRCITAADFNELGEYTYRFIQAPGTRSSTCHTTRIYQGDVFIGGNW